MERRKISEEQWKQLAKLHKAQNEVGFQSYCNQHGIDCVNIGRLMFVTEDLISKGNKYKMPLEVLGKIDERFLTEYASMKSDQTIKQLVDTYKIKVRDLYELYAEWYCVSTEKLRLDSDYVELDVVYMNGQWFNVLYNLIGISRLKKIFHC